MAKRTSKKTTTTKKAAKPASEAPLPPHLAFDTGKFEYPLQVGGIQTGSIDHPQPGGGQSCRVAWVDTGGGLRFVIALDRGGDIVQAAYNDTAMGFMTPNGYKPPNPAYHREEDWLDGWPGGLVTTCGPQYIGGPREEDGQRTSLHGHYSNTPAAIETIRNPDPMNGQFDMVISMIVRDTRFYGPSVEIRRQIQCPLGGREINIYDRVTNRANTPVPHHWLYHINLGYPLLDEGARFIYRGKAFTWQPEGVSYSNAQLKKLKRVPAPREDRTGGTSDVIFIDDDQTDDQGYRHVGLINPKRKLGLQISFPLAELPRLGNWQHFGTMGSYVSGIEPFSGSLMGKADDYDPSVAEQYLEPGASRKYHLQLRVLSDRDEIKALEAFDGPVTAR